MREEALRFCSQELLAYAIYRELASIESNPVLREALLRAAENERVHYEFWRSLAGGECGGVSGFKVGVFVLLRRVLGLAFTLRLLERSEREAEREYSEIAGRLTGELREKLEEIIRDEGEHEEMWIKAVAEEEPVVRYLGFIALGVADSIVELIGVFAGFLGATADARIAGLAGLVVGVAAALSMAGAAYAQARHEVGGRVNPLVSSLVTGASYMTVVLLLSAPFLLLENAVLALVFSLALALAVVSAFTLYSSILKNTEFTRDLAETIALIALTITTAYVVGHLLGELLGVRP